MNNPKTNRYINRMVVNMDTVEVWFITETNFIM